jgi:L-threonylcarbamoyladenylate synthase
MVPQEAVKILNAGGVIIFPTETLYGLGCDATNAPALLKIYQIKNRPLGKAFPILVKDFSMLAEYASFTAEHKKIITSAKQPTNFILKAKNLSPLAMQNHTAAFRIARHPWLKQVFRYFDKPIVATSANISGQPSLIDPRKYREIFGNKAKLIDAVVFNGINRKKKGSKILDLTKKPYQVLRA